MANYKLTLVTWYEDNEQAGSAEFYQEYVNDAAKQPLPIWNRCEAELQVNDGEVFKAVADGGPTKHPERKTKWPWALASEVLPPDDCLELIICADGKYWEKAMWRHYCKTFVTDEGESYEQEYGEKDFDHVWWRTIELPEEI